MDSVKEEVGGQEPTVIRQPFVNVEKKSMHPILDQSPNKQSQHPTKRERPINPLTKESKGGTIRQ